LECALNDHKSQGVLLRLKKILAVAEWSQHQAGFELWHLQATFDPGLLKKQTFPV